MADSEDESGGIPEGGFKNREELEAWLETQPREVSVAVAWRVASRVLPVLAGYKRLTLALVILRSAAISRFASIWPHRETRAIATAAYAAADIAYAAGDNYAVYAAADAAYAAAKAAAAADYASHAANTAAYAAESVADAAATFWNMITLDARLLEQSGAEALNNAPLWFHNVDTADFSKSVDWAEDAWVKLHQQLRDRPRSEDWAVWIDWYDDILNGKPGPTRDPAIELARIIGLPDEGLEIKEGDWKAGPSAVNSKIRQVLDKLASRERSGKATLADAKGLPEPEDVQEQTTGATQFKLDDEGRADLDASVGVADLLKDHDARDRHSETLRFADQLKRKAIAAGIGDNADDAVIEDADLLKEALGADVERMRPGLLIPRGEALRILQESNRARDKLSDLAPLPDDVMLALDKLVSAYNHMVGLDPELFRRDEARLGPDAKKNLVSPDEGRKFAQAASDNGAATATAADAIVEEARVAPEQPNVEDRRSRRSSES
jgi:hypothetical protein